MTIHIKGGEKLAVVGLNGAGKLHLLSYDDFINPLRCRILLNGIDIQNFDKKSILHCFPIISEVYTFAFPISENVSMQSAKETNELSRAEAENSRISGKLTALKRHKNRDAENHV